MKPRRRAACVVSAGGGVAAARGEHERRRRGSARGRATARTRDDAEAAEHDRERTGRGVRRSRPRAPTKPAARARRRSPRPPRGRAGAPARRAAARRAPAAGRGRPRATAARRQRRERERRDLQRPAGDRERRRGEPARPREQPRASARPSGPLRRRASSACSATAPSKQQPAAAPSAIPPASAAALMRPPSSLTCVPSRGRARRGRCPRSRRCTAAGVAAADPTRSPAASRSPSTTARIPQGTPAILEMLAARGRQRDVLHGRRAGAARARARRRGRGAPGTRSRSTATATATCCGSHRAAIAARPRRGRRTSSRRHRRRPDAPPRALRHLLVAGAARGPRTRLDAAAVVALGTRLAALRHAGARSPPRSRATCTPGDVLLLHDADDYSATDSWRRTAAALPRVLEAIARGRPGSLSSSAGSTAARTSGSRPPSRVFGRSPGMAHDAVARHVVDLAGRALDRVEDDVLVEP